MAQQPLPPQKATDLGVLGLGIIGSRVAGHLTQAGRRVWVWNRTPKPVACFLGSPADVASRADVLQIFVSDGPALLEVIGNLAPVLTPRHVVLAHSTVHPDETKAAANLVQSRGAAYLDAPFTGSKGAAESASLVYYVGGDAAVLESVRAVLEISSREILHLGNVGDATLLKIATNMVTASTVSGLAEALALVESHSLPASLLQTALKQNAACSPLVEMKLPAMLAREFTPNFSLANMHKDMALALSLLDQSSLPSETVSAFLEKAKKMLLRQKAGEDFSVIFESSSEKKNRTDNAEVSSKQNHG